MSSLEVKLLETIVGELKKNTKAVKNLSDRFDVRVEYVNTLRDGFMSLEDRIIIMEHSLACIIQERECGGRAIPPPPKEGEEYQDE